MEPDTGLAGAPPYTVYWYWSPTGIFQQGQDSLLGTGATLSLEEHPTCHTYWVKCLVVSSDYVVVSRIKKIDLSNPNCTCTAHKGGNQALSAIDINGEDTLTVYPNPSEGKTLSLRYASAAGKTLPLTVTDVLGREIYKKDIVFDTDGIALIDLVSRNTGIYLIRLQGIGRKQNTGLIIIQN
ncbi:MAG: T9SS type A sorting domain-containing protein [Lewinellaceae bacterium]|nr:T9SS type A sorting domain-containing protein [Lewinellaceae bacterium]